jgi:hypothetical protein
VGRSIRLVVVALGTAVAVAAGPPGPAGAAGAAASSPSTPQVVDDGTLAAGEKVSAPKARSC